MIFITIFMILVFIPFLIPISEIVSKRDILPINISFSFVRDPRYFGKSFRHKIESLISNEILEELIKENKRLYLKNDAIEFFESLETHENFETENIIFTLKGLRIQKNSKLGEVYSKGPVYVGKNSTIRALASDSDIFLEESVIIKRWIDSLKSIFVSKNCNLGVSASAEDTILLSNNVQFERLYAKNISSYNTKSEEVERESYIIGTIKADEDIEIKGSIEIVGNLISEGKIKLHDNVSVKGNVFSQDSIEMQRGVRIGGKNKIKSVVANGEIYLGEDVIIHGYVSSKKGKTV
ncbi:MAG: hypothetical protein ACPLKS_04095 [Caldisericum exile]|uniref:hypothetical protein n=1 Tax=Caldisericum exile TaxID=693075 RepID=UPI003C71C3EA